MKNLRIVLIDENEMVARAMKVQLEENCSCPVEVLRSPAEMDDRRYDIVFLNLSYYWNHERIIDIIEKLRGHDFVQLVVFSNLCFYRWQPRFDDDRVSILCKKGVRWVGNSKTGDEGERTFCGESCDGFQAEKEDPFEFSKQTLDKLSDREREILRMIGSGLTSREIGERLHISKRTVDHHREQITRKLEINGLPQLIAFAVYFVSNFLD